jgi:hypothetical protein
MAKKKKSWKKKLGKALMAGAALAGGLALAKRGNRAASIADNEAKESGFGAMTLKDYGPHKIGGYHTPKSRPRVDTSWMSNISPGLAYGQQIFKKGGRVGVGKAKRGFGRALKKGRK